VMARLGFGKGSVKGELTARKGPICPVFEVADTSLGV
jgi:hypothetical protein